MDAKQERILHLKIKVKTLAVEASINRAEARKQSGDIKYRLNEHRTGILRQAARENLLAYGLLKGKPYKTLEVYCKEGPNLEAVKKIALKFGGTQEEIDSWISSAIEYLIEQEQNETQ